MEGIFIENSSIVGEDDKESFRWGSFTNTSEVFEKRLKSLGDAIPAGTQTS